MFKVKLHFLEHRVEVERIFDPAAKSYDQSVHYFTCWSDSPIKTMKACIKQQLLNMDYAKIDCMNDGFFTMVADVPLFIQSMEEFKHGFTVEYEMNEEGKYEMKCVDNMNENEHRLWKVKLATVNS